jgi:hypothetical protein
MSGTLPTKLSDLQTQVNTRLAEHQKARQEEITKRVRQAQSTNIKGKAMDQIFTTNEI